VSKSLKKELQRKRRHAIKTLDQARHYKVRPDVYVKHWATALLFATTDTDDEQELLARIEGYEEEMDAIVACVQEDIAAEPAAT
jgi:hypothetical protein